MTTNPSSTPRRDFLRAAAAVNLLILKPELVRGTQRNSTVRLGLLGCGGRGSGVAAGFIKDAGAHLSAVADLFEDRAAAGKKRFDEALRKKDLPPIDPSQVFQGPNACERILESKQIDAIYIATPPYFHPEHLEKAVAAGKHVYLEKPVAVDVPGARRVIRAGEKASGKLSLAVGFQIRHATPFVELAKRMHQGAIGTAVCGLTYYYAGAIARPDWPGVSPATRRLRNWVHDRVLSGDIIVEQNIHTLDVASWIMNQAPLAAYGLGARKVRDAGTCCDTFSVVFQYPDNVGVTFSSRQFNGCGSVPEGIRNRVFGTEGVLETEYGGQVLVRGKQFYRGGRTPGIYQEGAIANIASFHKAVTSGDFGNRTVEASVRSNLVSILGRIAAYKKAEVTWDEMMKAAEKLEFPTAGLKS
jgi:myo-inositol 2-dehydrogenase / D-chiro-inositol 1-dehydrogenase